MKHEILTLQDVQVIGMSKKIAFKNPSECQKFWGEYVERIVKPVYLEGKAPDEFQKASLPIRNSDGLTIPAAWSGTAAPTSVPLTISAE